MFETCMSLCLLQREIVDLDDLDTESESGQETSPTSKKPCLERDPPFTTEQTVTPQCSPNRSEEGHAYRYVYIYSVCVELLHIVLVFN